MYTIITHAHKVQYFTLKCILFLQGINVSLVFIPTIKELLPSGMNYPLKYRINFTNSPINLISKKFTIKVSSIRTAFSVSFICMYVCKFVVL